MDKEILNKLSEEEALIRLKKYLADISFFNEASFTLLPELAILDYYVFSVMPKITGRMGEVTYLVNDEEILNGQPDHFDKLMKKITENKLILSIEIFAKLFFRMEDLRYGVILEKPDGHALIKAQQLPFSIFTPPSRNKTADGVNYKFWFFDTDRLVPVFYDVLVNKQGEIKYTSQEFKN
ncbi:MAG: hypothetical protein ABI472_13875 [Ginsengibacter sp.]